MLVYGKASEYFDIQDPFFAPLNKSKGFDKKFEMRSEAEDKVFHQVVRPFHFHEKQARSQGRVFPSTETNNLLNAKHKDKRLEIIALVLIQFRHEIKLQISSLKD